MPAIKKKYIKSWRRKRCDGMHTNEISILLWFWHFTIFSWPHYSNKYRNKVYTLWVKSMNNEQCKGFLNSLLVISQTMQPHLISIIFQPILILRFKKENVFLYTCKCIHVNYIRLVLIYNYIHFVYKPLIIKIPVHGDTLRVACLSSWSGAWFLDSSTMTAK